MSEFLRADFPTEKIKLTPLMKQEEQLAAIKAISPERETPEKIRTIYGDIYFPPAPEDRPYTFASIVVSSDGKIAFMDNQQGPLIAGKNMQDPDGGLADFWILNMLRFYADGVIIGAKTISMEPMMVSNVLDWDLADLRIPQMGKRDYCPWQVVVSFDGTDIPYDHMLFSMDAQQVIATSPKGVDYVRAHANKECLVLGPYADGEAVDTAEVLAALPQCDKSKLLVIATGVDGTTDGVALLKVLKLLGISRLLVESPAYMTYLMSIQRMDEMFINQSTVFAGGKIGFGAFQFFSEKDHPHSEYLQINIHQNHFLYTRQKMTYGLKED